MAQSVKINKKEHDPGLYDSDTGASCKVEKVVDITEDCPKASKKECVILLFTRAKRGRIVQISHPYDGEVYMGSHIHFFVDELDREMCVDPRDDTFGSTANRLGLTKQELRKLIEAQAPA
ncbi:MAG: hypothetical protein Q7K44_05145 [Candidatus Liptonbacteria bacterium]|nr:hypothetical protein [Candidatus Liptonbacteria bacterium]